MNFQVFSVLGLFAAFMIWQFLTMEADSLIHQSLQYLIRWNLDDVTVASSSFTNSVTGKYKYLSIQLLSYGCKLNVICSVFV